MTTKDETSPFVPGARVAIECRWSTKNFTEGFIDRVYKTGNFTLRGSSQQWRPWRRQGDWRARQTGADRRFSNPQNLRIWNDATNAEITGAIALQNRISQIRAIINRLEHIKPEDVTDEQVAAIEAALPKEPQK